MVGSRLLLWSTVINEEIVTHRWRLLWILLLLRLPEEAQYALIMLDVVLLRGGNSGLRNSTQHRHLRCWTRIHLGTVRRLVGEER